MATAQSSHANVNDPHFCIHPASHFHFWKWLIPHWFSVGVEFSQNIRLQSKNNLDPVKFDIRTFSGTLCNTTTILLCHTSATTEPYPYPTIGSHIPSESVAVAVFLCRSCVLTDTSVGRHMQTVEVDVFCLHLQFFPWRSNWCQTRNRNSVGFCCL